jgi:ribosomal protein L21E
MEEEALALMVQNLRIKLRKAEAQLAALKEAQATKQNAKAEGSVDDISTGDRVTLTWDRHWRYGTSKKGMPRTDMEGDTGTVERAAECYVWVRVDRTKDLLKKRKHNVTRLLPM